MNTCRLELAFRDKMHFLPQVKVKLKFNGHCLSLQLLDHVLIPKEARQILPPKHTSSGKTVHAMAGGPCSHHTCPKALYW